MNNSLSVQHYVPEQTIQSYLDALLQDAAAELALAEQQALPATAELVLERVPEPVAAEVHEAVLYSFPDPQPEQVEPEVAPIAAWREAPFEALLFDVGGLTLAVP